MTDENGWVDVLRSRQLRHVAGLVRSAYRLHFFKHVCDVWDEERAGAVITYGSDLQEESSEHNYSPIFPWRSRDPAQY
jgi:hypothetical protein